MIEWFTENGKLIATVFTVGAAAIGLLKGLFGGKKPSAEPQALLPSATSNSNQNVLTVNNYASNNDNPPQKKAESGSENEPENELNRLKGLTKILFIDDDTKFRVVSILRKSGWVNTKNVKDIEYLDCVEAREANIFFVDIQGVGVALNFKDEGLGLALALKNKYPNKKLIIYSTERNGERFHEALRKADTFLPKNAEPYEFLQIVEQFSAELFSK